jgi:hypothetical protein
MSNNYLIRFWTGPTLVKQLADKAREAGLDVEIEGTEHIYIRCFGSCRYAATHNMRVDLIRKHGKDFGL